MKSQKKIVMLLVSTILYFSFYFTGNAGGTVEKGEVNPEKKPLYGGVYRRGLGNDPVTLDPAKMSDIYSAVVIQQIVEGLVQYSENLMVIPCIAESWESSRDNLKWTFHLKKGVKFHNGREVSAEDFVYTFKRILNRETGSTAAQLLSRIKGAKNYMNGKTDEVEGLVVKGNKILEIELEEPFPPFIAVLAMVNLGVVPREEVERYGNDFGSKPVGTGPFRFVSWIKNREIVLEANSDYHEGRPYLDRIIFKIFPGETTEKMFNEFIQGNLEDSPFPPGERERVLNTYSVLRRPSLTLRFLVMNNTVFPFNDIRIRQAFNYAIDKERITEEVGKGRLISASGLIPQGMAGYQPDDTNYPYSPQKASELLNEAGFPGGKGLPVIQYWSSTKAGGPVAEDKIIIECLSEAGIKIKVNYLTNWPDFKKLLEQGKAPIFKYSWEADVPDPDNILGSLFYSKSPLNRSFYNNPEVDALILKAQNETNYTKRIYLYSTVQDLVMNDSPVILLNYLAYERVFQPYVKNYEGKALGDHYFSLKGVWLER